jgi:CheY-like chemotaxis protein
VLVVDDEAEARELLGVVLQGAGAEVQLAPSAAEALELLNSAVPDVLVSDIGMPFVDGYALIAEVRARGLSMPAIALTAYGRSEDKARALAAGFQLHVSKPVLPSQLLGLVETLARHATTQSGGQGRPGW